MPQNRTLAILKVLRRGGEDKLARTVQKIFGASSMEECFTIYEMVGKAERSSLDEAVARVAADASAAFLLKVDSQE